MAKADKKTEERKTHKTDPLLVKAGDVLAITYYVKVVRASHGGGELVVNDLMGDGKEIRISGASLVADSLSADQAHETVTVPKTEAARLLIESPFCPLTVVFTKADGTERTLRGRLISHEALLGRSMVEDLDLPLTPDKKDSRLRLVDRRTLISLTVDGVHYKVG